MTEPEHATQDELVHVEAFSPDQVRPWRYHNRTSSGMDDASLDALAASIRRDGQQQLGLARRLPPGDTHAVEAIFGVRRLEACRRAEVPWRAEVRDASTPDSVCAVLMHSENEWSEGVSPLENAAQWKAMLDAGVFANQSALAVDLGCHRGTVSRAIRTVTALLEEEWLERFVRPVMHEFHRQGGRSARRRLRRPRQRLRRAKSRARELGSRVRAGAVPVCRPFRAKTLPPSNARRCLYGARDEPAAVWLQQRSSATAPAGFNVSVRAHEQTPAELSELAEQIEALLRDRDCGGVGRSSGTPPGREP